MLRAHLAVWGLVVGLAGCEPPPATQPAPRKQPAPSPAVKPPPVPVHVHEPKPGRPQIVPSVVALSVDSKLALIGYHEPPGSSFRNLPGGKQVALWDVANGKRLCAFNEHEGGIIGIKLVAFLPDGKQALSAGGKSIRVWELKTGKEVWAIKAYSVALHMAALSPNGKLVLSWGLDDEKPAALHFDLKLWDVTSGKIVRSFRSFEDIAIRRFIFAPDSRYVFIASNPMPQDDTLLRVLDVTTGKVARSFKREGAWRYPYAFSPDGKLALSQQLESRIGARGHLVLWDLTTGKVVQHFPTRHQERPGGPTSPATAGFTPDGKHALVGDDDGMLRTWDVTRARELSSVRVPGCSGAAAFTPDARWLLVATGVQSNKPIRLSLWDARGGEHWNSFTANAER